MNEFQRRGLVLTKEPIPTEKYEIPKDLMIAISNLTMNGTQWKMLWSVFVNNYNNASREMSSDTMSEITGYSKRHLRQEMKKLFERRILTETIRPGPRNARVININKNYAEWE